MNDIFARLIRGVSQLHALPNIPQLFDITPVDIAADFVIQRVYASLREEHSLTLTERIFHLVHMEPLNSAQLLYLMNAKCDFFVNLVTPEKWIEMIQKESDNPLVPLLPKLQQWIRSLAIPDTQSSAEWLTQSQCPFPQPMFSSHLFDLPTCEDLFLKMIGWMRRRGYIQEGLAPLLSNAQARSSIRAFLQSGDPSAELSVARNQLKRFHMTSSLS